MSNLNSPNGAASPNSPARKKLTAAATSRNPITTLTELSHDPLLGIALSSVGNKARMKNGEAKVIEKARPPRIVCQNGLVAGLAVPPNPPRKGATQAELMIVNVS